VSWDTSREKTFRTIGGQSNSAFIVLTCQITALHLLWAQHGLVLKRLANRMGLIQENQKYNACACCSASGPPC
jgi:hypothetical protein